MKNRMILIIDDDVELAQTLQAVLKGQGYAVHLAADSDEGLALARAIRPDLVLLDIMMRTTGEGITAAQKFKQDESLKTIPIIMITSVQEATGFSFDPARDREFLPVEGFLEKPVDPRVLLGKIRKLIG